jgi:hypothetical protein
MRIAQCCFVILFASISVAAQTKSDFSATVQVLDQDPSIGARPRALLKITNSSQRRIFIDHNDLSTSSAIQYQDRAGAISGAKGMSAPGVTDGGSPGNWRIGPGTIGIEPGQSIIKLVRILEIKQSGEVSLSVFSSFPTTFDLNTPAEKWSVVTVEVEFKMNVRPH